MCKKVSLQNENPGMHGPKMSLYICDISFRIPMFCVPTSRSIIKTNSGLRRLEQFVYAAFFLFL